MEAKTCRAIIIALIIIIVLLLLQIYEGNKKLNATNSQLDAIFNDKYSLTRSSSNKYYYSFKKDCNIIGNSEFSYVKEKENPLEKVMNTIESMNIEFHDFNLSN